MSPLLKYTLARFGLFCGAAVVLVAIPTGLPLLLSLAIALLISMVLSYVLLRGLRDQVAIQLAEGAQRRAKRKDDLRAALAGDDDPGV
jgi:Protein of unknown function (DUF4229)